MITREELAVLVQRYGDTNYDYGETHYNEADEEYAAAVDAANALDKALDELYAALAAAGVK